MLRWTSRAAVLAVLTAAAWSVGAEPLNPAIPLAVEQSKLSSGAIVASLEAAQRAQELGLPTVAIGLYEELMAAPGADRTALTLPLATALLDAGRAADAEKVLNEYSGARGPEWRLRVGLAAAQQKRFDVARDQVDHINVDQLTRPDRAWFWFLQGVIADTSTPRDGSAVARANDRYHFAEQDAPSDFARAHFLAAEQRVRLSLVSYTPAEVEDARRNYQNEQQKGRAAYQFAEDYAVRLDGTGQKNEAVRFLSDVILRIPRAERLWTDRLRLLLGLIGERQRGGAGRNALNLLLEQGTTPDLQRQALQLLAQDSQREPERGMFRAELDKIIGATAKTAIQDGLLLTRAQLALAEKDYLTAERRANDLQENFPGSSLRPHAFLVLANSAWEQRRYRLAAENARRAREAVASRPGASGRFEEKVTAQTTAELRVFEAEAYYRARDFRLAAEAYEAALRQPPEGISAGDLMFQRALAAISADENDLKADLTKIVDELEADLRFDANNRWEAEWRLARGLKVQRKVDVALERVSRLLTSADAANVNPELRARMAWLQVRLSFDAGKPEQTIQLAQGLEPAIAKLPVAIRTEMASSAALLKAEAEFRLGRETDAINTLKTLRTDFPNTAAAIYSYLETASYYAGRDKIQEAQRALGDLIDNPAYKASPYVSDALFQLALLSERKGQESDLKDANRLIEKLVGPEAKVAAPPELVFVARLKQGDLLRTLNDFPNAQLAYEHLVNDPKYADRPDRTVAQLRLAECHNAQSSTDASGSHANQAQSIFEELLYRVSAPADVRVEAGYNLGKMLERRGEFAKARDVWWRDVIQPFLVQAKPGEATRATVPYWLARTLLDVGELLEQRENVDEARRVYVLLRESKLGYGEAVAAERLQRLGIPSPVSNPVAPAAKS
jgi:TolA-binding protein